MIGSGVRMKVYACKFFDEEKEEIFFIQGVYCGMELKFFQNLAHIFGEAVNVCSEVLANVLGVFQELFKIIGRDVIDGIARGFAKLTVQVLQILLLEEFIAVKDFVLGGLEHAVNPAEHGKGQNYIGILAPLEIISQDLICYRPDEINLLLKLTHFLTLF